MKLLLDHTQQGGFGAGRRGRGDGGACGSVDVGAGAGTTGKDRVTDGWTGYELR